MTIHNFKNVTFHLRICSADDESRQRSVYFGHEINYSYIDFYIHNFQLMQM
jgi:hypothetical protein